MDLLFKHSCTTEGAVNVEAKHREEIIMARDEGRKNWKVG